MRAISRSSSIRYLIGCVAALVVGTSALTAEASERGDNRDTATVFRVTTGTPVGSAPAAVERKTSPGIAFESAAFPLHVATGGRYLVDAKGKPFLIHGDTAWSLIAQLTREEAELYLTDRRARGFNTILVSLIEHRFAKQAPRNIYGREPFLDPGNYAAPNEEYFAHADWILRRAAEKGFLVLLAPSYAGNGGGSEGWYGEMVESGPLKLHEYGRYIARRYAGLPNIVWVHAGDYDPPQKELVNAIAEGIREVDRDALHTAHGSPGSNAMDYWKGEPWLRINTLYTYEPVHIGALREYSRPEGMPFFLVESTYENEHGATEQQLRSQAYEALLCGAAGEIFGNNPIWHFSGPGIFPAPYSWQEAMAGRGTQSMTYLRTLFAALPWWRLKPDRDSEFLVSGIGAARYRAVAARADDGSYAITYMPTIRDVTFDLSKLAGPYVTAQWYDPASGRFLADAANPIRAGGLRAFRPAGKNSAGFGDWVLLLTSSR